MTSPLIVDLDLIRKYNKPGPRYTSYPTAPQFRDAADSDEAWKAMQLSNQPDRPLSLYFHLPFCDTLCWFCGCTTVITRNHAVTTPYLDRLQQEIELRAPLVHPDRPVVQMHYGGGTPTFLSPDEILRLNDIIRSRFRFDPEAELGVEMDPRELTRDHVAALARSGFNRASIGVQDNDPRVQKAVNRIQPLEMTSTVIQWIREEGFSSLNIDLIYGLPYQTVASFEKTLDEILALSPDRFAVFSYAHVPWMKPAQKILKDESLPSPEMKLELLKMTIEKLTSSGYVYIGMDHFARQDDELAAAQKAGTLQRNFQGYSTRSGADIHAYGMSAISQTEELYAQNLKEIGDYGAALDRNKWPLAKICLLTDDDRIRRVTIQRLMCDMALDYAEMSRLAKIDFADYFRGEIENLEDLEKDGLLVRSASGIDVTQLGRLLIRIIAMRFDAYYKEGQARFSKTV
ncbi:MAG: oxygen-independent coproporphyrinogen III oxidase [Candidatus Hydrogenedentota bacterium]